MYPFTWDPATATTLARQRVDEQIRDAKSRRVAREVRQARKAWAPPSEPQPRRRAWSLVILRRALG